MTPSGEDLPPAEVSAPAAPRPHGSEGGAGLVSVVIPTRNRPEAVCRAVASVQAQTYREFEIIVVIDGKDPATMSALERLGEPRLKVIAHETNQGPGAARNTGIRAAAGHWVAFLDDDDEWLPRKLERQVAEARLLGDGNAILTCRVHAEFGSQRMVWPARRPQAGQHVSEYLIDRPTLMSRPGYVATPTIMVRRDLALAHPFPNDGDHEDWSWLLLLCGEAGARLHFVWEPLVVVKISETLSSRSHRNEWRTSLDWARKYRHLMTRMAFASFVLTKVAGRARRAREWKAFPEILATSFRLGSPRLRHLIVFAGTWLLPVKGVQKMFTRALSWA